MDFTTLVTFTIITLSQTVSIGPGVALIISESLVYGAKKSNNDKYIYKIWRNCCHADHTVFYNAGNKFRKTSKCNKNLWWWISDFSWYYWSYQEEKPEKNRANIPFLIPPLNPRVFLFFAAFMPSFIKDNSNFNTDFLLLCGVFIIISLLTDLIYICICLTLRERIRTSLSKYVNFISSLFILITGACLVLL